MVIFFYLFAIPALFLCGECHNKMPEDRFLKHHRSTHSLEPSRQKSVAFYSDCKRRYSSKTSFQGKEPCEKRKQVRVHDTFSRERWAGALMEVRSLLGGTDHGLRDGLRDRLADGQTL